MLQQQVITWLAALPVVLVALRVITIGDRLGAPVVAAARGGEAPAQTAALLAGLTFVGLVLVGLAGDAEEQSVAAALLFIAFGAFVVAHAMTSVFRDLRWQGLIGVSALEAGLFWLVLGVARYLVDEGFAGQGTESQAAIWIVLVLVSMALILGTFSRLPRDAR